VRQQPGAGREPVQLELADETFIAVDRSVVAALFADLSGWANCWPDLELVLLRERGLKGCQWAVTGRPARGGPGRGGPAVAGTAEIYLEPWHDGTLVHLFLRLTLPPGTTPRALHRATTARTLPWKQTITQLKDHLEGLRPTALVRGSGPGEGAKPCPNPDQPQGEEGS
jgi:hypothetical protein